MKSIEQLEQRKSKAFAEWASLKKEFERTRSILVDIFHPDHKIELEAAKDTYLLALAETALVKAGEKTFDLHSNKEYDLVIIYQKKLAIVINYNAEGKIFNIEATKKTKAHEQEKIVMGLNKKVSSQIKIKKFYDPE